MMYGTVTRNYQGACGTFTLHNFSELLPNRDILIDKNYQVSLENLKKQPSIGVFYAGFQDGVELSEKMFAHLCSICTPVYISPKRINPNSKQMFYFAVFELPMEETN